MIASCTSIPVRDIVNHQVGIGDTGVGFGHFFEQKSSKRYGYGKIEECQLGECACQVTVIKGIGRRDFCTEVHEISDTIHESHTHQKGQGDDGESLVDLRLNGCCDIVFIHSDVGCSEKSG